MKKILFSLVFTFFFSSAFAYEHIETTAVKVTATKVEKELLEVPASVSIITEEDIKQSSARTVGELLQDIPGVQVVNSGSQGLKRISLRGEGVNRTLILIDGQQIVENKSMDGTALMIDPNLIERIEVIRGPASVLYGSNAIGGVINIITKKGGKEPVEGSLSLAYNGASAGHSESGSVYGSVKGFDYRVSASYNEQGQLRTPVGLVPYSAFKQQNYSAYLAYNFNQNYKIGASYDYFNSDISSGSQAEGYENFYVDLPEWSRQKAAVFFEAKNTVSFMPKVRLDVFYQQSHKKMHNHVEIDPNVVYMPAVMDNYADNYNNQWGLQLQSDFSISDHTYIIAGYEFSYNILDADTSVDSISSLSLMNYYKHAKNYGYEQIHALYAQGESYLPYDFSLHYGIRWTYNYANMVTSEGTQVYKDTGITNILGEDNLGPKGSSSTNAPVVAAGVMWSGIDNFSLRLNFSQGFRSPNLQERYLISSMGGGTIYPNPDLKPETSNNLELGVRYSDYGVSIDTVYFVSIAENYIAQVPISTGSTATKYKNVSNALSHGAEIGLAYTSPVGIKPYVNMTVMQRRYTDDGVETWKTGVPLVSGRAGIIYMHTFNNYVDFKVDLFSRFASETEDSLDSIHAEFSGNIYYAPWATANIAISAEFGEKRQYSLSTEVYNLLNKLYQTSVDIYEPGIYGAVKFTAKF